MFCDGVEEWTEGQGRSLPADVNNIDEIVSHLKDQISKFGFSATSMSWLFLFMIPNVFLYSNFR